MFDQLIDFYLQHAKPTKHTQRNQLGIFSGIIGLFSNLTLFLIKFYAGFVSGSVSIITDSVNNLADSGSSLLTLIGFSVAGKPPDKKHPYGHERFEYIIGLFISFIILFVGIEFLTTSFKKILSPSPLSPSFFIIVLLILSIFIKWTQGRLYGHVAKRTHSQTIQAASQDSLNDVLITFTVLLSFSVEWLFGWQIDGYVGFIIALYILYSGIVLIKESIDDLLGTAPHPEEINNLIHILDQYESIVGYHDLLIHYYGPNKRFATVHIEIDDSWNLVKAHEIIDSIEKITKEELSINLVCHIDPIAIRSKEQTDIYRQIKKILHSYSLSFSFHDFRVEEHAGESLIRFDAVVPDNLEMSDDDLYDAIVADIHLKVGFYSVEIDFDHLYFLK
ncbi:cation diffusion facilitator family transporter [Lacticigenium naphthae]|uniref:cation diffusion facilitator family transporter n=1 Tax=Lacticigenium naphthae TaxID=515351 RepID=UPI0004005E84|nr:cation diffusion facilitator family transporter [Lacticigenium naphthae]